MNQNQEPIGPLMKAAQKYVAIFVCIVDVMLLIGAIRSLPEEYLNWLYWVCVIMAVLLLVIVVPFLIEAYRKHPEK